MSNKNNFGLKRILTIASIFVMTLIVASCANSLYLPSQSLENSGRLSWSEQKANANPNLTSEYKAKLSESVKEFSLAVKDSSMFKGGSTLYNAGTSVSNNVFPYTKEAVLSDKSYSDSERATVENMMSEYNKALLTWKENNQ